MIDGPVSLHFRQARSSDAAACAPLIERSGPDLINYLLGPRTDLVATWFAAGKGRFGRQHHIVADRGGEVVAVAALMSPWQYRAAGIASTWHLFLALGPAAVRRAVRLAPILGAPRPDGYFVAHVAVRPDVEDRGIATALLRELVLRARSAGAGSIQLAVSSQNWRAQSLYRKLGFRPIATLNAPGLTRSLGVPAASLFSLDLNFSHDPPT